MEQKKIVPPYQVEGYEKTGEYSDEDDADLQIFDQLIGMGSDLSKPRHTIHYFYFELKESSVAAAEQLQEIGFNVALGEPLGDDESSRRWPVTADRTEVIKPDVMRDCESRSMRSLSGMAASTTVGKRNPDSRYTS